ncbi:MAG: hypothetical protein P4N41_14775 [Negativicutes bacterium]|nr:hypothetical protein [Negativicutes bacterium]
MSIIKFLSSLLYTPPVYKVSVEGINEKLSGYQKTLESLGFAVRRADQTLYFTPAQLLVATRDNTILEITMDVTGYEGISYSVQTRGFFGSLAVGLTDFDHALAMIGAKETATPVQDKKIA